MNTSYKIYDMQISDDPNNPSGFDFTALVDNPAIEEPFFKFSKEEDFDVSLSITDEEKRIISGPVMIPDKPIFRNDKWGKYFIRFSKDVIKKAAIKNLALGFQNKINTMHDENKIVDGVQLFESWVSDESRGVKPLRGFEDLPDGTLFRSYYVTNDNIWNDIKNGNFKGFSVEFTSSKNPFLQQDYTAEMLADEIISLLSCTEEDT